MEQRVKVGPDGLNGSECEVWIEPRPVSFSLPGFRTSRPTCGIPPFEGRRGGLGFTPVGVKLVSACTAGRQIDRLLSARAELWGRGRELLGEEFFFYSRAERRQAQEKWLEK